MATHNITKTCLYNFDSLKPQFYIVKLGFAGVYINFLVSAQKHRLWYSLEPPLRGGSNEYSQSMFWAEVWKISEFLSENFRFLVVKFSVYLNRHVFVMNLHQEGTHFFPLRVAPLEAINSFLQEQPFFKEAKYFMFTAETTTSLYDRDNHVTLQQRLPYLFTIETTIPLYDRDYHATLR